MSKEKTKKNKRTEEQAAFIVGNRKEMCSCEALKDRAERLLKMWEGPPMVNIAEFYMQKTNGSAIAEILSSRYAAKYAKK